MPEWTPDKLERALRAALLERSARIRTCVLPPSTSATVEWSGNGKAKMRLDDHETPVRTAVLHELMHLTLEETLAALGPVIAEWCIEGIEKRMDERIGDSPRRRAWWRRHIEQLRA